MSKAHPFSPPFPHPSSLAPRGGLRRGRGPLHVVLLLLGILALGPAGAAVGATAPKPVVPPGFTITRLASAPSGTTNCDDLAWLDGHLFMTCQNTTLSGGGGGNSTIAEYADDGTLVNTWSIPDKADGIGADPLNHRLIVTLNEDAHSHLATITPSAPSGQQVTNYSYSPGPPGDATTTGALHTGGGTDSVSVDSAGHVYITGSHAAGRTGTAVFRVVLTAPAAPGATGTAALNPTYLDNATATNGNTGSGTVNLSLGDVDSGAIVPYTSPRYAGNFVIDDQTNQQLVFASNISAGTGLTVLKTPFGLDDIRWATSDGGMLYVVDKGAPAAMGASALYKVAGPFVAGTALASNDGLGNQVVTVNLATGALTPFVSNLVTTKGLVYVDASGSVSPLALAPLTAASATNTAATGTSGSEDSDTLTTILLIVILVVLVGAGGFGLMRREGRTA